MCIFLSYDNKLQEARRKESGIMNYFTHNKTAYVKKYLWCAKPGKGLDTQNIITIACKYSNLTVSPLDVKDNS